MPGTNNSTPIIRLRLCKLTLADGGIIDKRLGKHGIKMIRSDLAQENLVRKIVVRYLNRRCVNIIKYDEISPLKAETKPKIKACTRFAINIQVNLINYNQNEREREKTNTYL